MNHHWRRRYNDRRANEHGGRRFLDNDGRRHSVPVRSLPPIPWSLAIGWWYRQIGGQRRRDKSYCTGRTKDRFKHGIAPFPFVALHTNAEIRF
jgi:hypothetical protein